MRAGGADELGHCQTRFPSRSTDIGVPACQPWHLHQGVRNAPCFCKTPSFCLEKSRKLLALPVGLPYKMGTHSRFGETGERLGLLFETFFSIGEVSHVSISIPARIHAGGTVGGDRHYRHLDRSVVAGGAGSPRSRPASAVYEQPLAVWGGASQLSRHVQSVLCACPRDDVNLGLGQSLWMQLRLHDRLGFAFAVL